MTSASRSFSFFGGLAATALAAVALSATMAPAMAHPHNSQITTCSRGIATAGQRTILMRFPGRQPCLISVRPGQDDRAAAFEAVYGGRPMTTADANQLQSQHRVTAVWVQGNGLDEVHFQPWN